MEQTRELSSDVVYEILSRTPLTTLERCKSLSKEYNDLAYDSRFLPLHANRTSTMTGYVVQDRDNRRRIQLLTDNVPGSTMVEVSLDFLPCRAEIVASSSQGILCCCGGDYKNPRYYVCKPCTRQWRELPNPKMRYVTSQVSVVVLSSNPLRYKIIRLSIPRFVVLGNTSYRCEIFDSSSWKWRELDKLLLPHNVYINNEDGVVASNSVFWLLANNQVLEFKVETESFERFDSPDEIMTATNESEYSYKGLVMYKGKLTFVCEKGGCIVWWVMTDYINHIWEKREALAISRYPRCSSFFNAGVAVFEDPAGLIFYNVQDGSFTTMKPRGVIWKKQFPFRSDLEPVQFREGTVGNC